MAGDLAIDGGTPEVTQPLLTRPMPEDRVKAALHEVYANGTWSHYDGPSSGALSELITEALGVEHVYLCASGTIGVELALRGAGIGPEDEVLLAAYDFAGNYRAIEAVGARPVLIDIDSNNWAVDLAQAESMVRAETKALIVSHLHGAIAPMDEVRRFADQHQLRVVEDACQAPGATDV